MIVIPAIDLRGGRCVRLLQGDFAQETVYGDDPVQMALRWQAAGAAMLHVVDLDGARAGEPLQAPIVAAIAQALTIPVQLGGGLRSLDHIAAAFAGGVSRVVLGTAAIEDRELLRAAIEHWGAERIILGVDAREGLVATRGWIETTAVRATELARELAALGLRRVVYTDIGRDGTLHEPNYAALAELAAASDLAVIASGGVAKREHLPALAALPGVEAVIVGRALYTGDVVLGPGEWKYEV
ncbi:MAG TPA: 1-(5-phosphoribosyl)-5-[(5-phosphoribosylamino)methylideneamino]imidazole-4-carboxamide isomerase [Thermomicrobiales bacterium]|jgi:phosphoribosylformimino-5-aminoimidazole carboxamide ribotide isomerase